MFWKIAFFIKKEIEKEMKEKKSGFKDFFFFYIIIKLVVIMVGCFFFIF